MCCPVCSYVGGWFARLVILTSSPYSSELLVPGWGLVCLQVLLCVRLRRLLAFGFLWEREQVCEVYTWANFVVCASIFMYLRWWVNSTYNGSGLLLFFLNFLGV